MSEPMVYQYDPTPDEPLLKEGVTKGWLVLWDGAPGPARVMETAALVDDEGNVFVEQVGEWQDATVYDDREEGAP